jgi:hypothetical protein
MKAFFLFLNQFSVSIYDGVKTRNGHKGPYIQLPEIESLPANKFRVPLDFENPAKVDGKGKIHNLFFKIYGGQKFRDAGFVTACAPWKDNSAIAVFTNKRWTELGLEIVKGKPNGQFPGVQILNEGDILRFTHSDITYQLTNSRGEPYMNKAPRPKPTPAVKQVKPEKPVEKIDNRQKVQGPKVVDKIDLPEKRRKTPEVVAKQAEPEESYVVGGGIIHYNKPATTKMEDVFKGVNIRPSES